MNRSFHGQYRLNGELISLPERPTVMEAEADLATALTKLVADGKAYTDAETIQHYRTPFKLEHYGAKKDFNRTLERVLSRVAQNQEDPDAYATLFTEGSKFTGFLRELNSKHVNASIWATDVLKKHIPNLDAHMVQLYPFLRNVPLLVSALRDHITETEGFSCSTDKVFYVLSEYMKELLKD